MGRGKNQAEEIDRKPLQQSKNFPRNVSFLPSSGYSGFPRGDRDRPREENPGTGSVRKKAAERQTGLPRKIFMKPQSNQVLRWDYLLP